MRLMRYLQRERKHKKTNANQQNQNLNWKKCSGCDIMKETPEPRFEAWFIKYELEIFLLNINEDMICTIVEGTNEEINGEEFRFRYSDTTNQRTLAWTFFCKEHLQGCNIFKNKYEWLIRTLSFHYHNTVRADFLDDRFAHMRWSLMEFENNTRKYYRHTEFAVIDETLRNFYV